MAGLLLNVNSGEVALVADEPKVVLAILAATNAGVKVSSLQIMGKQSAGGTDQPVKVRITRVAASGTVNGTGTLATAAKNNVVASPTAETIQTLCYSNFTTAPSSQIDSGLWYEFNPQSGLVVYFPPGQELDIPGGYQLNVECTSNAGPTLVVAAGFTEGVLEIDATSGSVALSSTLKTVLYIKAATTRRVLVHGILITGGLISSTAGTPCLFRLYHIADYTTATVALGTATVQPSKRNPSDGETIQTTTLYNVTTEPTNKVYKGISLNVPPLAGNQVWFPFDKPIPIPGGAALGIEGTSTGSETPSFIATAFMTE